MCVKVHVKRYISYAWRCHVSKYEKYLWTKGGWTQNREEYSVLVVDRDKKEKKKKKRITEKEWDKQCIVLT